MVPLLELKRVGHCSVEYVQKTKILISSLSSLVYSFQFGLPSVELTFWDINIIVLFPVDTPKHPSQNISNPIAFVSIKITVVTFPYTTYSSRLPCRDKVPDGVNCPSSSVPFSFFSSSSGKGMSCMPGSSGIGSSGDLRLSKSLSAAHAASSPTSWEPLSTTSVVLSSVGLLSVPFSTGVASWVVSLTRLG